MTGQGRGVSSDCTCWTAPITDTDEAVAACPVHRKGRTPSPLEAHFADKRRLTTEAIKRGLDRHFLGADTTAAAESVMSELEQMWRNEEMFS